MKQKSLFITLASGLAFAYAAYRLLEKTKPGKPVDEPAKGTKPSDFESHANPRTPLSELKSGTGRTGSGLDEGTPRPDQTSDWYGNKPKT